MLRDYGSSRILGPLSDYKKVPWTDVHDVEKLIKTIKIIVYPLLFHLPGHLTTINQVFSFV